MNAPATADQLKSGVRRDHSVGRGSRPSRSHLDWLESEAIYILREVAGQCQNPVLFFSGGKDSICLLRLAEKAFRPGRFPFPLLHVDTGHNYPEVIAFRDRTPPLTRAGGLPSRLAFHFSPDRPPNPNPPPRPPHACALLMTRARPSSIRSKADTSRSSRLRPAGVIL